MIEIKKAFFISVILACFSYLFFCTNNSYNEMRQLAINSNDTRLFDHDIIVFEDSPIINLPVSAESDRFLFLFDEKGNLLHYVSEEAEMTLNIEDFFDLNKTGFFKLVLLSGIQDGIKIKAENPEELIEVISKTHFKFDIYDIYYNQYPEKHPISLITKSPITAFLINGFKYDKFTGISLKKGEHSIGWYDEKGNFSDCTIRVDETDFTQEYYLPENEYFKVKFIDISDTHKLNDKYLNLISISSFPIANGSLIFKEETVSEAFILDNMAKIPLDTGIKCSNLNHMMLKVNNGKREIFKKYFPVISSSREKTLKSLSFLENGIEYDVFLSGDDNVSIMDTEWYTDLKEIATKEDGINRKNIEEFEKKYTSIAISSNKKNVDIFINGFLAGKAPITLWILKDENYTIEAGYNDLLITHKINKHVEEKEINFDF